MNRLPASQRYKRHERRWKRYEKQLPGHRVQVDVKFIEPIGRAAAQEALPVHRDRRLHPASGCCGSTTATTRRPRSSSSTTSSRSSRSRVEVVQTDNGAEFQGAVPLARPRPRHRPRLHQARTPRLNGKVERSHRIDAEEFYRILDGVVIDDTELFNDKLQEWEDFYNFHRPHGGLDGQTPYERLRQKTTTPA